MTNSPEETYIQNYQKHLKHQSSFDDHSKGYSNQSASTKHLTHYYARENCTICRILNKSGDLFKILNQGLFFKFTASQDYFYTRDINALLLKKRRAFCIRYYDNLIFDECKERLKIYFPKKEAITLLIEIKDFYCHFKVFPKNFHPHFYKIMESNIKKHRHLEYIKVFDKADLEDEENTEVQNPQDQKDTSKGPKENQDFNIMDMLGNSFLRDNYKDVSGVLLHGLNLDKRRDTERLHNEIDINFKELDKVPKEMVEDHAADPFSNALYNNNYMLYSRNDSETAGDMLKQIVQGFKDDDFSKKVTTSLAEKVLQQKIVKKLASKNSGAPVVKQRISSGSNFAQLVQPQTTKAILTLNNFSTVVNLQQLKKKPKQQGTTKNLSAQRGSSNPRSSLQVEVPSNPNNIKVLAKDNPERVIEHKRTTSKLATENLHDVAISREKILHKIDQFRSTRSKSGALKTILTTNKSDSVKGTKNITLNIDTVGMKNQAQQSAYFGNTKSQSPSPERRSSREDYEKPYTEAASSQSKTTAADSPFSNYAFPVSATSGNSSSTKLKRTISGDFHGRNSSGTTSHHKKSQSLIKRANAMAKTHQTNPSIQLYASQNTSNSMNMGIVTNYPSVTQLSSKNSDNTKFVKLNRQSSGTAAGQSSYYFRNPSPVDDYLVTETDISQKSMEKKVKVLNIKALNTQSSKKLDNYRVATMSLSGRHNFSEVSQLASSLLVSNKSFLVSKNKDQANKKKVKKTEIDAVGRVIPKRNSGLKRQATAPLDNFGKDINNKSSSATVVATGKKLELNAESYATVQNIKSPIREVLYSSSTNLHNLAGAPATTTNKGNLGLKVSFTGPYSVKANSKEFKFPSKK